MGKFENIAKFLGLGADHADDAAKILEKVDNPELATKLIGDPRAEYLKALDETYGPAEQRAKDMGFGNRTWYHGTTVDIPEFQKEALGLSTNAQSAKKGFFFANDPSTASDYAELAMEKGVGRGAVEEARAGAERAAFIEQMQQKYGPKVLAFGNDVEKPNWTTLMTPEESQRFSQLDEAYNKASDVAMDESGIGNKLDYKHYQDLLSQWHDLASRPAQEKKRLESLAGWEKAKKENADWLVQSAKRNNQSIDDFIAEKTQRIRDPILSAKAEEIEAAKQAYYQGLKDFAKSNDPNYAEKILNIDLENKRLPEEQKRAILEAMAYGRDQNMSKGQQVGAYRLRGNPEDIHVKNYKGQGYRDTTYADEMTKAQEQGKKGVLFKNTYDPADPNNRVKQDIAAVFEPEQIRSVNAAFDPRFKNSSKIMAGVAAMPTAQTIDPLQYFKGAASAYKTALGKVHDKLAEQMDLTKDGSAKEGLKEGMGLALDPLNVIDGPVGLGLNAMSALGEEKKNWRELRDYLK